MCMCIFVFLCHDQLIDSAQDVICKMPSQKHHLAMNFREVVVSNAPIKTGRIVITNGMITFEHHTDSINVDGVRDGAASPVYTIKQGPSVIRLHS